MPTTGIPVVPPLPESPITGTSVATTGVTGKSNMGVGVLGTCIGGPGSDVAPASDGVMGIGKNGVHGESASATDSGVWGNNTGAGFGVAGSSVSGSGVLGSSKSGYAGEFVGNVLVTGILTAVIDCVLGADCAEEFDVAAAQQLEPGTVVVIDDEGALRESRDAYDKKVAGIVSGAGGYRPGIVLDRRASDIGRTVVALVGKVYCRVDAEYAPIEVGDLLTPSQTPGHAMKASDPSRAFGAVIGKALRPLQGGRGLVPVLVALQ